MAVKAKQQQPLKAAATSTTTTTTKPATNAKPVTSAAVSSNKPAGKPSNVELNTNISEKTSLRRGGKSSSSSARSAAGSNVNERQERRRTDRHSRTGYKQDGEKRLTSGKGSWGRAVEPNEQHVTVDESVAIAEGVEGVQLDEESSDASDAARAAATSHLTLAQYQASLKKPVSVAPSAPRKVSNSALSAAQIVKKDTEVFVFPEIVKSSKKALNEKSTAAAATTTTSKSASIDVSKFISVKAVSNVESQQSPRPAANTHNQNNKNNRSSFNKEFTQRASSVSSPKLNLKDDRAFPALGSK